MGNVHVRRLVTEAVANDSIHRASHVMAIDNAPSYSAVWAVYGLRENMPKFIQLSE